MEDIRMREFDDRIVIGPLTEKGVRRLTGYSFHGTREFKEALSIEFGIKWDTIKDFTVKFLMTGEVYLVTLNKK